MACTCVETRRAGDVVRRCVTGETTFETGAGDRQPVRLTYRGSLLVKLYRQAQLALLCAVPGPAGSLEYVTPRAPGQRDPLHTAPPEFVPGVLAVGTDGGGQSMEQLRAVLQLQRPKILARWGQMSESVKAARGPTSCIVWGCGQPVAAGKSAELAHMCGKHVKVGPATRACVGAARVCVHSAGAVQSDVQLLAPVDCDVEAVVLRPCTNCHLLLPVRCFPEGGVALERLQCLKCMQKVPQDSEWGKIQGEAGAGMDRDGAYRASLGLQPRAEVGKAWDNPAILSHAKHKAALMVILSRAKHKAASIRCCISGCSNMCTKDGKLLCDEHFKVRGNSASSWPSSGTRSHL